MNYAQNINSFVESVKKNIYFFICNQPNIVEKKQILLKRTRNFSSEKKVLFYIHKKSYYECEITNASNFLWRKINKLNRIYAYDKRVRIY